MTVPIMAEPEPGDIDPQAEARALLRGLLASSRLSLRQLAVEVLGMDERTVRRWINQRVTIPAVTVRWLRSIERLDVEPARVIVRLRREKPGAAP